MLTLSHRFGRLWFQSRLPRRSIRIVLECLLLILAISWLIAPYAARAYINGKMSGLPDYTGRIEWIRLHPITCSADLYDLHLNKKGGQVGVPFLNAPRFHVSLQWSQLFHGVTRASLLVVHPRVNLVTGPSEAQSQVGISGVWIDALKAMVPWRINQVQVVDGDVHFLDLHASPPVDLELNQLNVQADNMSNSQGLKVPLPAQITISAAPLLTGTFVMHLAVNFDERFATFTQDFKMEHVPAVGANSALQEYLKVRVKSGTIGLYSQLSGDKGVYHGYVKPFFSHLEFEPKPSDEGTPGAIWSGVLNMVKSVFQNDQKVIATQTEISGRVDDPQINALTALTGVLWNAYIQALRSGFDPSHAPAAPTDTVTTPESATTEKEAEHPSPAAK